MKEVKLNLTNNHIEKAKLNKETNSKLCKLVCVNLSDERLSTFEKFNTAFQSIFKYKKLLYSLLYKESVNENKSSAMN